MKPKTDFMKGRISVGVEEAGGRCAATMLKRATTRRFNSRSNQLPMDRVRIRTNRARNWTCWGDLGFGGRKPSNPPRNQPRNPTSPAAPGSKWLGDPRPSKDKIGNRVGPIPDHGGRALPPASPKHRRRQRDLTSVTCAAAGVTSKAAASMSAARIILLR